MRSNEPESLSDIIFQRSLEQKLQFENAFAPILATLVILTGPEGIQGKIVVLAAIILVILTFLRWLTFTGRFSDEEAFIENTVRPVELCAIIGVVQIFSYGAESLAPSTGLSPIELTTTLAVIGTIIYIALLEFIFHTYRLGWGALFYLKYRRASQRMNGLGSDEKVIEAVGSIGGLLRLLVIVIFRRIWFEIAYFLLSDTVRKRGQDKYMSELAEFVEGAEKVKGGRQNIDVAKTFVTSAFIVLPVFVAVAWGLSILVGTFWSLVLTLTTMRLTKHLVGFSYIAFGTLRFDQFITTNKRSVGLLVGYTAVVYLVFFYPL